MTAVPAPHVTAVIIGLRVRNNPFHNGSRLGDLRIRDSVITESQLGDLRIRDSEISESQLGDLRIRDSVIDGSPNRD